MLFLSKSEFLCVTGAHIDFVYILYYIPVTCCSVVYGWLAMLYVPSNRKIGTISGSKDVGCGAPVLAG